MLKKISLLLFCAALIWMGINHFRNPENFYVIMPAYLIYPHTLNFLAGGLEVVFGAGMLFITTRKWAAYGFILLLIAFFSVHIYMIRLAPFELNDYHISVTVAWIRLVLQFPLIFLVWIISKQHLSIFEPFKNI